MPLRLAIFLAALTAAAGPSAAQNATYRFEWTGSGGYSMRGALSFPAALVGERLVLEDDLECFAIEGYRDGQILGRWALGMLTEETTWTLSFDPAASAFVVWGPFAPMPQAWNMDGFGDNCGEGGFGFNIGNAAQDLCLDGALLRESQVEPSRPFPAERDDDYVLAGDACRGEVLMGALIGPEGIWPVARRAD